MFDLIPRLWLDGIECTGVMSVQIRQEMSLKVDPYLLAIQSSMTSTTAEMRIGFEGLGKREEKLILEAQENHSRLTLAQSRGDSVLIAANLLSLDYQHKGESNDSYAEILFRHGDPLRIVSLDEWLSRRQPMHWERKSEA